MKGRSFGAFSSSRHGEILGGIPAVMPRWTDGDHPWFTGDYPATLGDEINLDSSQEDKDLIARTNDTIRSDHNQYGYILVGKCKDEVPPDIHHSAKTIEGNDMLTAEILKRPERLINSRGGKIHLFPVLPDWAEVTIQGFLTRGGFEVSASRRGGIVNALLIKARRNIPCCLVNPWTDTTAEIQIFDLEDGEKVPFRMEDGCIIFSAHSGHRYDIAHI